jgi:hypothetical protein
MNEPVPSRPSGNAGVPPLEPPLDSSAVTPAARAKSSIVDDRTGGNSGIGNFFMVLCCFGFATDLV